MSLYMCLEINTGKYLKYYLLAEKILNFIPKICLDSFLFHHYIKGDNYSNNVFHNDFSIKDVLMNFFSLKVDKDRQYHTNNGTNWNGKNNNDFTTTQKWSIIRLIVEIVAMYNIIIIHVFILIFKANMNILYHI